MKQSRGEDSPRSSTSHGHLWRLAVGTSRVVAMHVGCFMGSTHRAESSNCSVVALKRRIGVACSTRRFEQQYEAAVVNIMRIFRSWSSIPEWDAFSAGTCLSLPCVGCAMALALLPSRSWRTCSVRATSLRQQSDLARRRAVLEQSVRKCSWRSWDARASCDGRVLVRPPPKVDSSGSALLHAPGTSAVFPDSVQAL